MSEKMTAPFEGFLNPHSLERVTQDKMRGIYFLFKDEEIIYIGSSLNVFIRTREHDIGRKNEVPIEYDYFSFLSCSPKELRELEKKFIRHFKPRLNKMHSRDVDSSALLAAVDIIGSQKELAQLIGIAQPHISRWIKSGKTTAEYVIAIERATKGQVTRHQLRPDLYPKE